jgi:subtilisin family serine protease
MDHIRKILVKGIFIFFFILFVVGSTAAFETSSVPISPLVTGASNLSYEDIHPLDEIKQSGQNGIPRENTGQNYGKDRLIVRFKSPQHQGVPGLAMSVAHARVGATIEKDFSAGGITGLQIVQLPRGTDLQSAIKEYESNPDVLYAEPDYEISVIPDQTGPVIQDTGSPGILSYPDDARFSEQWDFHNIGQSGGTPDADIDAPEAWDISTGSNTVIVAVPDTGVFYTHEDLSSNIWTNTDEIPGNGIDDDFNGYVDDVHGWDFVNNDNDPSDDVNHGTHCAGTIGAIGNNALGVAGINWRVKIMPLKIMDSSGYGNTSDAIKAFEYARVNGAAVISNSWGREPYSQAMKDAIDESPAVVVFAAGNDGNNTDVTPHYPSSYASPGIISVAATDNHDTLASFSNYGTDSVDLAAPGANILSTNIFAGSYVWKSGTSMAAPHVAGVAALIKSMNQSLTSAEIKKIILDTVDAKASLNGKVLTGGRLNAHKAIKAWNSSPVMVISSITPNVGVNTTTVGITDLSGTNFKNSAKVQLNQSGISNPVHTGSIKDGSGGALMQRPNSIFVSGKYAYIPGLFSNSLEIVDITYPDHPAHKGSIKNGDGGALLSYPYNVYVSGNNAYVASYGSNALEIVDVTNPAAPFHKGSITDGTGGSLIGGPQSVFVSGNYAYIASSGSNALEIVDVTNPAVPVHKGSISDGAGGALLGSPHSVFVSGTIAFVASYNSNTLEIVDVTNPTSPVHKGSISDGTSGALLKNPENIFVSGNYAYIASYGSNAIEIVNITNPSAPVHTGSLAHGTQGALLGGPRSIYVTGNYAYVASSGSNALEIVDVTDPAAPAHKGSIIDGTGGALLDWPTGVFLSKPYIFVASWNSDALEIIDPGFIPATGVTVVSPTRITCTFDLIERVSGKYNVVVSNPDGPPDDLASWNNGMLVDGFTITSSSSVLPLPGFTNPPTDPDTDNLYEDLNANNRKDFNDVVLMFNQMQWVAANEPVSAFDFNGNGRIDFNDIVKLFGEI